MNYTLYSMSPGGCSRAPRVDAVNASTAVVNNGAARMKTLKWWSKVDLKIAGFGTPVLFDLVPPQVVDEDAAFFSHILEAVKASGMDYVLIETDVRVLERHGSSPSEVTPV